MRKHLILIFCLITVVLSCKKDKVPEILANDLSCDVSFAAEIAPLINMNCSTSGCHDSGTASKGYDLTTHAAISENADVILSVMNHDAGLTPMPQGQPKLVDSIIAKFACWKMKGKLDN